MSSTEVSTETPVKKGATSDTSEAQNGSNGQVENDGGEVSATDESMTSAGDAASPEVQSSPAQNGAAVPELNQEQINQVSQAPDASLDSQEPLESFQVLSPSLDPEQSHEIGGVDANPPGETAQVSQSPDASIDSQEPLESFQVLSPSLDPEQQPDSFDVLSASLDPEQNPELGGVDANPPGETAHEILSLGERFDSEQSSFDIISSLNPEQSSAGATTAGSIEGTESQAPAQEPTKEEEGSLGDAGPVIDTLTPAAVASDVVVPTAGQDGAAEVNTAEESVTQTEVSAPKPEEPAPESGDSAHEGQPEAGGKLQTTEELTSEGTAKKEEPSDQKEDKIEQKHESKSPPQSKEEEKKAGEDDTVGEVVEPVVNKVAEHSDTSETTPKVVTPAAETAVENGVKADVDKITQQSETPEISPAASSPAAETAAAAEVAATTDASTAPSQVYHRENQDSDR